jgi:hypothetical protein
MSGRFFAGLSCVFTLTALAACGDYLAVSHGRADAAPVPGTSSPRTRPAAPPQETGTEMVSQLTPPSQPAAAGGTPATITFAVIGDFGDAGANQIAVVNLIKNSFKPDIIITVGDNNYNTLSVAEYDNVVGQFFHEYIGNYTGTHGPGSPANRFWPALGNHDWNEEVGYQPYLNFFTLPGNERYYDVVIGPAHLFFSNSDSHEPDGRTRTSAQANWLKNAMAASTATWKFVVFHHPPFSSSDNHGSIVEMQWPFKEWGAHAVFCGHDHTFERLDIGGIPYFISGHGGRSLYGMGPSLPQSRVRFNDTYGAMKITVDEKQAVFTTYSIANGGTVVDSFTMTPSMAVPDLVPPAAVWKHLDNGTNQGTAWRMPGFNDSAWASGGAQLGYGDGDETTVVSYGGNAGNKYITTYFRRAFTVADPSTIHELRLALLRDDGAVVYINGTEVARMNMPVGTIGYLTLASFAVGDTNEDMFFEAMLDPCVLVPGTNVIAVEIHQSSPSSSDIGLDLMLTPILGERVCSADVSGDDGVVGVPDLLTVINSWGPCAPPPTDCPADLSPSCGDNAVGVPDLLEVINGWGPCV